ncbi:MAG: aldo/keto reductase [Polyangiaceae bacterium]|nr:aldo/keto reductase [Polyangiaceae bacterium]
MSTPRFRPLGRTGVQVSPLTLGCMMFGGRTNLTDSCKIIDRALDSGINFLDTADAYSRGESERVTGEALQRNGKRGRVVLATKVHFAMADDDPNSAGNSRRHIIESCEASLVRLKTDYIDLYQIHRPQSAIPIDETLRALDDLIRAGKVRYVGTSTFAAWQCVESLWVSKEYGLNRFVCEQPPYNILDRRIERELLPMARTFGYGVIPWSPLAGGLLTGKYSRANPPPSDSRYAEVETNPHLQARYVAELFDVVDRLSTLSQRKECTISALALAWVMAQPGVTSPIIGPRTLEQLEDNLKALQVLIGPDDEKAIDAIVPPGSMLSPFYRADFGPHPFRV